MPHAPSPPDHPPHRPLPTGPTPAAELPLPHERDQAPGQSGGQRDVMRQAHHDIETGQVDTDMRATPGLDASRRRKLVPPSQ